MYSDVLHKCRQCDVSIYVYNVKWLLQVSSHTPSIVYLSPYIVFCLCWEHFTSSCSANFIYILHHCLLWSPSCTLELSQLSSVNLCLLTILSVFFFPRWLPAATYLLWLSLVPTWKWGSVIFAFAHLACWWSITSAVLSCVVANNSISFLLPDLCEVMSPLVLTCVCPVIDVAEHFSCFCWPLACLFWSNVCFDLLPIFKLDYFVVVVVAVELYDFLI